MIGIISYRPVFFRALYPCWQGGESCPIRAVHPRARSISRRAPKAEFRAQRRCDHHSPVLCSRFCASPLRFWARWSASPKAFVDTAPTLDLAALDAQDKTSLYKRQPEPHHRLQGHGRPYHGLHRRDSEMLQNAFIAVEDALFTSTTAWTSSASWARWSPTTQRLHAGGSTITQQLIKRTVLSSEQSTSANCGKRIWRWSWRRATPKQILESYLNTIFLGGSYYGVARGGLRLFRQVARSAHPARMCDARRADPKAPISYNPRSNFYTRNTEGQQHARHHQQPRPDYVLRA